MSSRWRVEQWSLPAGGDEICYDCSTPYLAHPEVTCFESNTHAFHRLTFLVTSDFKRWLSVGRSPQTDKMRTVSAYTVLMQHFKWLYTPEYILHANAKNKDRRFYVNFLSWKDQNQEWIDTTKGLFQCVYAMQSNSSLCVTLCKIGLLKILLESVSAFIISTFYMPGF